MQKEECGEEFLCRLTGLEDLAKKKTAIYARLLTDTELAKSMETLSLRHTKRMEGLNKLLGKTCDKNKKGQGRYETTKENDEK